AQAGGRSWPFSKTGEPRPATDFSEPIFAGRSDKHGTRQRQCTIFCRLVSDLVRRGPRWHDNEVAALCEIALKSQRHYRRHGAVLSRRRSARCHQKEQTQGITGVLAAPLALSVHPRTQRLPV